MKAGTRSRGRERRPPHKPSRGGSKVAAPTAAQQFDALEAMRSSATVLLEGIELERLKPKPNPKVLFGYFDRFRPLLAKIAPYEHGKLKPVDEMKRVKADLSKLTPAELKSVARLAKNSSGPGVGSRRPRIPLESTATPERAYRPNFGQSLLS
jgi:hypothetical protein